MTVEDLFTRFAAQVDLANLWDHTERLWQLEMGQTDRAMATAARYAAGLLRDAGMAEVELLEFPADGKTAYQDKTMPLAWRATRGSLRIVDAPAPITDPLVADYQRHPFHLMKGSGSTPPEGIEAPLCTEDQFHAGEDVRGALVIANPETPPRPDLYKAVADRGALGVVTDWLRGRYETPDALNWVNAWTEGPHWHVIADDRPLIGFVVSPRVGDQLRAAPRPPALRGRVICDGEHYEGTVHAVTGLLPGEDPREIWLLAHLYEPLADDNSSGVAAGAEIARVIADAADGQALPRPRFSLRVVFAMEMYGFAAVAEHFGGCLRDRVIGALNLDGMPITDRPARLYLSPPGSPCCADYLAERLADSYQGDHPVLATVHEAGMYADDCFLADSTTGLATLWLIGSGSLWHNSAQTMERLDQQSFMRSVAFNGALAAGMLALRPEDCADELARAVHQSARRLETAAASSVDRPERAAERLRRRLAREIARVRDFVRVDADAAAVAAAVMALRERYERLAPEPPGRRQPADDWEVRARGMVPRRLTCGLPYDLQRVPKAERRDLPDRIIYGPLARILANMDGRTDLLELMRQAEWEHGKEILPKHAREFVTAVDYLADHGYLETTRTVVVDRGAIVDALRRVGVRAGDLLFVHSSLTACGYVAGGADTVIDALLEVLGPEGTLLLPTFGRSFTYFAGQCARGGKFAPFRADAAARVWVGRIPQAFLRREGITRSAHPTHSVAGIGPLAAECLESHAASDPPTGPTSPFAALVERGGRMLWFGAGLASTTFFHYLEDRAGLPYLAPALCHIETADGALEPVLVPRNLPGHRDFYRNPGEECKIYRRLLADGLEIRRAPLGQAELKLIDARRMADLGLAALADAPDILLCDDDNCHFCRRWREDG